MNILRQNISIKNGDIFATVYSSKSVTVFLNQTIGLKSFGWFVLIVLAPKFLASLLFELSLCPSKPIAPMSYNMCNITFCPFTACLFTPLLFCLTSKLFNPDFREPFWAILQKWYGCVSFAPFIVCKPVHELSKTKECIFEMRKYTVACKPLLTI